MAAGRGKKKKKPFRPRKPRRKPGEAPPQVTRVKLPRPGEMLGLVTGIMGGSRMTVLCNDGKERLCRIPGKMRKRIWVKEGDVVALKPWDVEGDKKADITWRYSPLEASWLKKHGHLKVG